MRHDDLLDRLIPRSVAYKAMGLSRTSAWRYERNDPSFPRPLEIAPGTYRFRLSDVQRWIDTRPIACRARRAEGATS